MATSGSGSLVISDDLTADGSSKMNLEVFGAILLRFSHENADRS